MERPRVGLGVFIRHNNKILLGKRIGEHGTGTWCPPGGHLDKFESFNECVIRETTEEVGVKITNIALGAVTNDFYAVENKHYVTITMTADLLSGEPQLLEPDKFERWEWFSWTDLPTPLFTPIEKLSSQHFDPFAT